MLCPFLSPDRRRAHRRSRASKPLRRTVMRRQPLSSRSSDKLRRLLEKPLLFRSPEGRAFSRIRGCQEPRVSGRWCEVTVKEETPGPMPLVLGSGSALSCGEKNGAEERPRLW
jgi:hypothetical protein